MSLSEQLSKDFIDEAFQCLKHGLSYWTKSLQWFSVQANIKAKLRNAILHW